MLILIRASTSPNTSKAHLHVSALIDPKKKSPVTLRQFVALLMVSRRDHGTHPQSFDDRERPSRRDAESGR
jgi:hypothetical protein